MKQIPESIRIIYIVSKFIWWNGHNYKVTQHRGPLSASPVAYAPQILAVVLARILGLGGIMRLLLGRLFASAFYILAGYYALKKMPFAKRAMMILMLGPSAIQQAASFSYDCVLNSCAFIFIALVLHCAYEKQHVNRKDWILLVVTSIVMSANKNYIYFDNFLCFLNSIKENKQQQFQSMLLEIWSAFGQCFMCAFNENVISSCDIYKYSVKCKRSRKHSGI